MNKASRPSGERKRDVCGARRAGWNVGQTAADAPHHIDFLTMDGTKRNRNYDVRGQRSDRVGRKLPVDFNRVARCLFVCFISQHQLPQCSLSSLNHILKDA